MRLLSETTHLKLPLIAAAQAQKHVTHNEAIRDLDLLVMVTVLELFRQTPPAEPQDGDPYIVGENATDAWEGHDFKLAAWIDGTLVEPLSREDRPGGQEVREARQSSARGISLCS